MATDREIALEQALIAVLGATQEMGLRTHEIATHAKGLVVGHTKYRQVEHPHVSNACAEIDSVINGIADKAPSFQTDVKI